MSSITSNVVWKFAERFSAQIVSFIVSLVLARLLMPSDYGTVALILVFIEIANVFVSAGLGSSLIQKKDADDLDFSSVLYFNFVLSVGLYLVLFFTAPIISDFYDNNLLTPIIRVFGIRIIIASINSVQQAYVSRKMIFKKFFLATLFGTIISGVIGIFLAYRGFGAWALVAQYLINVFVDTVILAITLRWKPLLSFSWLRVKNLFKFGWKILAEGLANTASAQIRSLIIGKVYREEDLGHYSKAQQFPQLIMTNINSSISAVLFPAMSNIQEDDKKLLLLTRKSVKVSSYLLFPMLFGIAAVSTNLVTALLTEKWMGCVPFLYIFCLSSFLTVGMYSRHEALKAKGKSGVYLIENMISRLFNLILLILVFRINVFAVALSGIGGTIILLLIIMFTSKRYNGYRYIDQIRDVAGLTIMSCFMFAVVFLLGYLIDLNPLIELVVQFLLGIFIYLVFSHMFKPEGYVYLLKVVKRVFLKKQNGLNINYQRSKLNLAITVVMSFIPCCFLRFLPVGFGWIFVIQVFAFLATMFLTTIIQKNNVLAFLSAYIDKTTKEYDLIKGEKEK